MVIETIERAHSDLPIPPGELLAEELDARGMTQKELADRTGRPEQTISEIINGKKAITHDTALELDKVLGIPAHLWVNLESSYQLTLARNRERSELEKYEDWLTEFPIKDLQELGHLPTTTKKPELLQGLLSFFGVASFPALRHWQESLLDQYRITEGTRVRDGALWAWLRVGYLEAEKIETEPYNETRFRDVLVEIKEHARQPSGELISEMKSLCASAGVAFVLIKEFKGTGANGVARWLSPNKGLIQMSTMRKYFDIFLFSFLHEAKHVLELQKRMVFVDDVDDDDAAEADASEFRVFVDGVNDDDAVEADANEFAREFLIPLEQWERFVATEPGSYQAVKSFAAAVGVEPGIVVGRLQKEKVVPYSHLNRARLKFVWTKKEDTE